jgi:hypothetical protein
MSITIDVVDTPGSLSNFWRRPSCWTTQIVAGSSGTWWICTAFPNTGRFGQGSSVVTAIVPVGRSNATQVGLAGRDAKYGTSASVSASVSVSPVSASASVSVSVSPSGPTSSDSLSPLHARRRNRGVSRGIIGAPGGPCAVPWFRGDVHRGAAC